MRLERIASSLCVSLWLLSVDDSHSILIISRNLLSFKPQKNMNVTYGSYITSYIYSHYLVSFCGFMAASLVEQFVNSVFNAHTISVHSYHTWLLSNATMSISCRFKLVKCKNTHTHSMTLIAQFHHLEAMQWRRKVYICSIWKYCPTFGVGIFNSFFFPFSAFLLYSSVECFSSYEAVCSFAQQYVLISWR